MSKTVTSENWDRVKVVCTQPFNKTSTFGLSFINFHSPSDGKDGEKSSTLGAFRLKDDSASPSLSTGNLFAHRKERVETPLKGAAAVRVASKIADEVGASSIICKTPSQKTPTMSTSEGKPSPLKRKHSVSDDEDVKLDVKKTPLRKQATSLSSVSSSSSRGSHVTPLPPLKKTKSEPSKESPVREFGALMKGVVFVLSGYQNPYRGELRDMAMEMGAQYRGDWGRGCTHLICAFTNTPKYSQVKGKGKIVGKSWIVDSYKNRKLLPWRRHRVGNARSPEGSSESDDDDEDMPVVKKRNDPLPSKTGSKNSGKYKGDTDSGDNSEDEPRKVRQRIEEKKVAAKVDDPVTLPVGGTAYGDSTDEDEPEDRKKGSRDRMNESKHVKDDSSDSGLPDLPDFFADKVFYFYGEFPPQDKRLLSRYIAAYDGITSEYMSDIVNFVVTLKPWDDNFEDALGDNSKLIFVKPKWIEMCHEKNRLVPYQAYIVVPK